VAADPSHRWLPGEQMGKEMKSRLFSDVELVDAYRKAAHDYAAAKAGTGNRVEALTSLLVAERVLISRLGVAGGAAVGARSS
jgi:hypothetical protein